MTSIKIAVLSRNSKLYSTSRLVEAAKKRNHDVRVVDHTKCFMNMEQGKPTVTYKGENLNNLNAIIPRIGASVTFFGTAVVHQFEMMNVFTTGSALSITRTRDKLRSLQMMARSGVGIPKTAFAKFPKNKDVDLLIEQVGGAPVVIKLLEGTQGLGVVLAETDKAAKSVIEAFSGLKQNIIVQEFIKEAAGEDIRVLVVNNEVVGAMRRKGQDGEFRSNLHRGGKAEVVELSDNEKEAALRAAAVFKLGVAGVDMLRSKNGPLILEVNSSPGLKGIEQATGVDIAGKIIEYMELSALVEEQSNSGVPYVLN